MPILGDNMTELYSGFLSQSKFKARNKFEAISFHNRPFIQLLSHLFLEFP